jgi:hypothetical protein
MSIEIGTKGVFTLAESVPQGIPGVVYEVTAINTIYNLIALGLDVYNIAYTPYGISEDVYKLDPEETEIVTLHATDGTADKHVPMRFIVDVDSSEHIEYANKALMINLGDHPRTKTFHRSVDLVKQIFKEYHGLNVYTRVVEVSAPAMVKISDHKYLTAKRKAMSSEHVNLLKVIHDRETELEESKLRISALELYIQSYLRSCNPVECSKPVPPLPIDPCIPMDAIFRPWRHCRFRVTLMNKYVCSPNTYSPGVYTPKQPEPREFVEPCPLTETIFKPWHTKIGVKCYYFCDRKVDHTPKVTRIAPIPFACTITIEDSLFRIISSGAFKGTCPIPYYIKGCK